MPVRRVKAQALSAGRCRSLRCIRTSARRCCSPTASCIPAFAAHGDVLPYHGWELSYAARTLRQVPMFNTSPNDPGAQTPPWYGACGIRQGDNGLTSDASGNIYFVTDNGYFDRSTGDYGDSVGKINPLEC